MLLFIPIIIATIFMFVSYFVFFVNIAKLQARLRKINANLPVECLYLNTLLLSAIRVGSKNLITEIKAGSLSSLGDDSVNSLCRNVVVSENIFKISVFTFIGLLLISFALFMWVILQ